MTYRTKLLENGVVNAALLEVQPRSIDDLLNYAVVDVPDNGVRHGGDQRSRDGKMSRTGRSLGSSRRVVDAADCVDVSRGEEMGALHPSR